MDISDTDKKIKDIFGIVGTILEIIFALSPYDSIKKLIKKELLSKDFSDLVLILGLFCNIFWVIYGIERKDFLLWFNSIVCFFILEVWFCIYIYYLMLENLFMCVITNCIQIFIFLSIFVICLFAGIEYSLIAKIAMVFCILDNFAPGQNMYKAIKTNDYNILPISIILSSLALNICWLIYGVYLNEIGLILANLFGILVSAVQLMVYLYTCYKALKEGILSKDGNGYINANISQNINQALSFYRFNESKDLFSDSMNNEEEEQKLSNDEESL